MWTPDDQARLERVRYTILRSWAMTPDAFAEREPLWMLHARLHRKRHNATT